MSLLPFLISSCHCQNTGFMQYYSCIPPAFHGGLLEDAGSLSLYFYPFIKQTAPFVEMEFTCQGLFIDPTQCLLPLAQVVIMQTKIALLKHFLTLYNPQSSTCTKAKPLSVNHFAP